ncbi:hypothetical protein IGB42_00439 [Andreprevotia sp. IGB-42]|uniref:DUF6931 family protein n=1 Tax=Andreprevotia sp. IGB-42 TaxID=2497473 RepID=UPI00135C9571|nr:hypothetical protein [Andreprevotia sp. IGB-42]KAF0815358.1 hypothetical protein IGB42_00439 [Andreprevotia sp. IGB-42]
MPVDLAAPAAPVLARFTPSEAGQAALGSAQSVAQAIGQLADGQHWPDALHLLAHALPKRDAVCWAWSCATSVPAPAAQEQTRALASAQQWLKQPEDACRRGAFSLAEAAGFDSAAASVALAVFWSGASISAADEPEVLPFDHLCHHAAGCAVQLAGLSQPERTLDLYRQFIMLGSEIAAGKRVC